MASSSCSYAAVALARSIFRKGASFTAAMVFELASTNLVIELGVILAVLMGWQFTAAEFAGGILMVILIALIFRLTLTPRLVEMARQQAERGALGRMEGHAAMDMSVDGGGPFVSRLLSGRGYTAVSHLFVMDWASVWLDVVLRLPDRRGAGRLGAREPSGSTSSWSTTPRWPRSRGRWSARWWPS